MIIVRIKGGLGNQLFQYATARSLSIKLDIPLKLDISSYPDNYRRQYRLKHYNIKEEFASTQEIKASKLFQKGRRFLNRSLPFHSYITISKKLYQLTEIPVYVYNKLEFNDNFFDLTDNVYLDGYWQSEKYFLQIEEVIREEYTLKDELGEDNISILKEIKSPNSVSVHIRNYDLEQIESIHCMLPVAYYNESISEISKIVDDPVFYVFSDNIDRIKDSLQTNLSVHYINSNKNKPHLDLFLMSNCQHNIIANSTFSWWGAWLNQNPEKIVYSPIRWFKKNSRIDTRDLIPEKWIKIDYDNANKI
jgi:hypothetical protein